MTVLNVMFLTTPCLLQPPFISFLVSLWQIVKLTTGCSDYFVVYTPIPLLWSSQIYFQDCLTYRQWFCYACTDQHQDKVSKLIMEQWMDLCTSKPITTTVFVGRFTMKLIHPRVLCSFKDSLSCIRSKY